MFHGARLVKHWCWLVALFFFPGVGVVDDEVRQRERACCFGGGDQAVDRLGVSGEWIRSRAAPGGGEGDFSVFVGVGAIEHGAPALGRGVVVADKTRVIVRVNALLPRQARRCGDRAWCAVSPVPLVFCGSQGDRDVAAQQIDHVGLGRVRDRDDCGNESVRI